MNISLNLTTPIIFFCLTLVSGFILQRTGLSGNVLFTSVHKLCGVAAIVLFILQLVNAFKLVQFPGSLVLPLVLSGLFVIVLIASGGLLTVEHPQHNLFLLIHRLGTLCAIAAIAFILYTLKGS